MHVWFSDLRPEVTWTHERNDDGGWERDSGWPMPRRNMRTAGGPYSGPHSHVGHQECAAKWLNVRRGQNFRDVMKDVYIRS